MNLFLKIENIQRGKKSHPSKCKISWPCELPLSNVEDDMSIEYFPLQEVENIKKQEIEEINEDINKLSKAQEEVMVF